MRNHKLAILCFLVLFVFKEVIAQPKIVELIPYNLKGKWGYANSKGEIIIDTKYDRTWPFGLGILGRVQKDGNYGFVNAQGVEVVKVQYQKASDFLYGVSQSRVELSGKRFSINFKGEQVKETSRCGTHQSKEPEIMVVKKDGKFGAISALLYSSEMDKDGNFEVWRDTIPMIYEGGKVNKSGIFYAKKNGKWGGMDINGKAIVPFIYDEVVIERVSGCYSTFTKVRLGILWGALDRNGRQICFPKFKTIRPWIGMNEVETVEGIIGYIDKDGCEYFK